MHKIEEKLPSIGQIVIAYCPNDKYYFARYLRTLTWTGYKLKFVNIASKGLWHDDVIGWNRVPDKKETL